MSLRQADGTAALRYSDLLVQDADGELLAADLAVEPGSIRAAYIP